MEIGPRTGVLTQFLLKSDKKITALELDEESVEFLNNKYKSEELTIIHGDFLKANLPELFKQPYGIIGNFPYNISSQIFFRVIEERNRVPEVVCMLQKEVAQRICSPPGSKVYGILSVLLQAYYDVEYLFTVKPDVFIPPPKVDSGVIRLTRNSRLELTCDPTLFKKIVKQGFQNRRKTLRNALKPLNLPVEVSSLDVMSLRAEQLSVEAFIELTKQVESGGKHN